MRVQDAVQILVVDEGGEPLPRAPPVPFGVCQIGIARLVHNRDQPLGQVGHLKRRVVADPRGHRHDLTGHEHVEAGGSVRDKAQPGAFKVLAIAKACDDSCADGNGVIRHVDPKFMRLNWRGCNA